MKMVSVQNIDTGVDFILKESDYKVFKKEFLFKGYVEQEPDVKPEPVSLRDINQWNKTKLVEVGKELGLEVTDKMTNQKLKDAITDYQDSQEDDIVEI